MQAVTGVIMVSVVILAAVVGLLAFMRGEDRRRAERLVLAGRRATPAPSIGEAVRQAHLRGDARALVLFLGDDPASAAADQALGEDPTVLRALGEPHLLHTVVRAGGDERQVAQVLFEKYARAPLPEGPACLLLDGRGQTLASAAVGGPLPTWLGPWLSSARSAPLGPSAPPAS
jgi:hypothetical protein